MAAFVKSISSRVKM